MKTSFENRRFGNPRSFVGVPGAPGSIADSIMEVPGVNSEVIFLGWNFGLCRV